MATLASCPALIDGTLALVSQMERVLQSHGDATLPEVSAQTMTGTTNRVPLMKAIMTLSPSLMLQGVAPHVRGILDHAYTAMMALGASD